MRESASVDIIQSLIKGVIAIIMAILLWVGYNYLNDPQHFPVRIVKVSGKLTHVTHEAVQSMIAPYVERSLVSLDIVSLSAALKADPWVQEAHVKRVWPDTVWVDVTEHQPVAYWGDHAMVDDRGQRFTPKTLPVLDLPHWDGPPDELAQVYAMNQSLNRVLAPAGLKVAVLVLSARWSWQVVLSSGLRVDLGSHDVVERLARFVKAAPFDVRTPAGVQYVDLRYTNGFVVNSNK